MCVFMWATVEEEEEDVRPPLFCPSPSPIVSICSCYVRPHPLSLPPPSTCLSLTATEEEEEEEEDKGPRNKRRLVIPATPPFPSLRSFSDLDNDRNSPILGRCFYGVSFAQKSYKKALEERIPT